MIIRNWQLADFRRCQLGVAAARNISEHTSQETESRQPKSKSKKSMKKKIHRRFWTKFCQKKMISGKILIIFVQPTWSAISPKGFESCWQTDNTTPITPNKLKPRRLLTWWQYFWRFAAPHVAVGLNRARRGLRSRY